MIRGVWSRETVGWVLASALLPVVAALLLEEGFHLALRILGSLTVVAFWQAIFRYLHGTAPTPAGAVIAVSLAVLSPGELTIWQIVLAVSFGTVLGDLIFGGWGRNVFSASTIALAFLFLSFPELVHASVGGLVFAACILAGALLIATGIVAWQILLAAVLGWTGAAFLLGVEPFAADNVGTLAFAAIFLIADPVASTVTRPGRWIHGALGGALAALIATGNASLPQAVVFAALLASIFAPLIDQGVIAVNFHKRSKTHG